MSCIVSALDALARRDSLVSQLRALGVPRWPWGSNATLRCRLDCAAMFGTAETAMCSPAPIADRAEPMEHLRARVRGMLRAKRGQSVFAGHAPR